MRTKNTLKTFLYGVLLTSFIAILGLLKTKLLLQHLGKEYVGIYQLFYQLYTYISLVDGGIGASIAFHLYKPVADNDTNKINSLYAGAKYYFKKIGILVVIMGIMLSFCIMFFIKETTISSFYIRICFILFVASSATSYFTTGHALIYEAEQKLYKSSNLNHLLQIFESITCIIVALLGGKLLTILIIFLVLSVIKNIILVIISKKDHKYLKKDYKKDLSFKKEANSLIISKVNTLINENIDVVILSSFVGLTHVVIYTTYNQIINMIKLMVQRLNSALLPSIGNLLVLEKEKAKNTFVELNSILFFIGSLIFVPLFYMLNPFIKIWYGSQYAVSLFVCLLFVLILYINVIKITLETFIKAAGEFKSIKQCSIYQSVTNLGLSLLLVGKYKIMGVLIATIFSFLTGIFFYYPHVISRKIINDRTINYYKKVLKYILGLIINIFICYFVNSYFHNESVIIWLFNGIIIFTINLVLTFLYYKITKEDVFIIRLKKIIGSYRNK